MTLNGNLLYKVKYNNSVLYEDVDFIRTENSVILKSGFLSDLPTSSKSYIVFEFTDGSEKTCTIYPKEVTSATVSGIPAKGKTITANAYYCDQQISSNLLNYQWYVYKNGSWHNITSATSNNYEITTNEANCYVCCRVQPKNGTLYCPSIKYTNYLKTFMYGDVDIDGVISILDSTIIQRYLAGLNTLDYYQQLAADVDGDNEVTILDATIIQSYLAGVITAFPVEEV